MTNTTDLGRTLLSIAGALLLSTTFVAAAVAPFQAAPVVAAVR